MKVFQNPIVVGGLALVAVLMIFRSTILPLLKKNAPAKRPPAAKQTPSPSPVAEQQAPANPAIPLTRPSDTLSPTGGEGARARPATAAAGKAKPNAAIDLARVGWAFNGTPPRDPFQLSGSVSPPERLAPPASEVLKLTAIWRQTGGSLAVINGKILRAGDAIEGFQIERIETNQVWVNGPAGRESLEFKPDASALTNASPKTIAAPPAPGTTAIR